jgi:hypothetical protein
MQAMNAIKTGPGHVPVQSHRVAIDFLLLAAAAIMAGLVTAAVAAALVILLSASANAVTQTRDDAPRRGAGLGSPLLKTVLRVDPKPPPPLNRIRLVLLVYSSS